jgi:ElaB/YqjD/DUF883 family membrane-anchored ribosome-binding protein
MTFKTTQVKKIAGNTVDTLTNYLNAGAEQAYATGSEVRDYIHKNYPAVVEKARDMAQQTAGQSRAALRGAGSQMGKAAHVVGTTLEHTERRLMKMGMVFVAYKWFAGDSAIKKVTDDVKKHVNENPVQSVVIALGAGYVLGKLFR